MSGTAKENYYYYYTLSITLQHWYHTLIDSFLLIVVFKFDSMQQFLVVWSSSY